MNTKDLKRHLKEETSNASRRLRALRFLKQKLVALSAKCSDSTRYDMSCGIPYVYVFNREDLAVIMTLAPIWKKEKVGKGIQYYAEVTDGVLFYINAYENALPPTCRVVTQTREVAAHTVTEETVVCETS